jgi:hypothetical protein
MGGRETKNIGKKFLVIITTVYRILVAKPSFLSIEQ